MQNSYVHESVCSGIYSIIENKFSENKKNVAEGNKEVKDRSKHVMKCFQMFSKRLREESKRLTRELRGNKKKKHDEEVGAKVEEVEKEGTRTFVR